MRHTIRIAAAALSCLLAGHCLAAPLTLWYSAPAGDWEREALPIGNGAIGAMVFGGVDVDELQFTEKTLWTGGPGAREGYDFGLPRESQAAEVAQFGQRLLQQGAMPPEEVVKALGRKMRGYGDFQSLGRLLMRSGIDPGSVTRYRRTLDLARGLAGVEFESGGVHYRRQYFVSYPDRVIVVRFTADRPGSIDLALEFGAEPERSTERVASAAGIAASGALDDNGLRYAVQLRLVRTGGTATPGSGGALQLRGADEAVLIIGARTDYKLEYPAYRGADPIPLVAQDMTRAVARGYDALLERHHADHSGLFGRVALELAGAADGLSTDELLAQYGKGNAAADRALEQLYFQFGRYLLIGSSRPGSLPANLQGAWNAKAKPPWNSDYHLNINIQMNYWLAETTNLAETTGPLFDFVDELTKPGRDAARTFFGARGWTAFLNTNIHGYAGPIDWPTAFWQPEAGAWLAQHYYERYLFGGDVAFLRERAWPVMKGAAEFWLDTLVPDAEGRLVVTPSYSPEHGPFTAGAAMSQQIVFDLFTNVAAAARTLRERGFEKRVRAALAKLDPGLRVGGWGQLQEWRADLDDRASQHRHVSHLFALHPGRQLVPLSQPELARAARTTLDARGDGGTGWSMAWKINFWARLLDGDRAHKMLATQLTKSTLPNLWDTHPPFQIDGNFGATAGIAEMLLQSQHGEIHILPALPTAWPQGRVSGLRARGDVEVAVEWSQGRAKSLEIRSGRDGPILLRSDLLAGEFTALDAQTGRAIELRGKGERRELRARAGARYVIAAKD